MANVTLVHNEHALWNEISNIYSYLQIKNNQNLKCNYYNYNILKILQTDMAPIFCASQGINGNFFKN